MSETCSKCGKQKPTALYLQDEKGKRRPLCKECSEKWLEEDSDFPKLPKLVLLIPPDSPIWKDKDGMTN